MDTFHAVICETLNQKLNGFLWVSASMNSGKCSRLIAFLNHISVTLGLFGCSVIEKVWRKSTKYKNVIYV